MRHVAVISKRPALAADSTTTTSVCASIDSDFQTQLCFVISFLTEFILPLSESILGVKGTDSSSA